MKVLTAFGLALCYASIAHAQTVQWTQILDSSQEDRGRGVSADGMGNVYVTGWTTGVFGSDAFVSKYDSSGAHQWTRQLGADFGSDSHSVSADGMGNIYISGGIGDSPFEPADFTGVDAFVSKYDSDGTFLWTRKLATIYTERNNAVSADSLGNIFVAGFTWGNLDGLSVADADGDAFLAKYDADGSLAWTRQFGTSHADIARGVSADGSGNVYVSGWTDGNLADGAIGPSDGFVRKYDSSGMLVWTRQLGTLFEDQSTGISADGMGNVYVTGYTEGDLEGTNAGIADAYLVK